MSGSGKTHENGQSVCTFKTKYKKNLAGPPTVRFDFFSALCSLIVAKNTPLVSQRGIKNDSILFSVNWYPFISW